MVVFLSAKDNDAPALMNRTVRFAWHGVGGGVGAVGAAGRGRKEGGFAVLVV